MEAAPGANGAGSSTLETASEGMGQKVRDQLKTSAKTPAAPAPKPGEPEGEEAVGQRPGGPQGQGPANLTAEQKKQMEKVRKVMENLSEEEKEQLMNMSMEERAKFFREKMEE